MADETGPTGMYALGIALILGALLLSASVYFSVSGLAGVIAGKQLNVNVAGSLDGIGSGAQGAAGANAAAGNNQQPAQQPAAQQQPQAQQPSAPQAMNMQFTANDPAIGPKDAKATVVEFADFQCPYCAIVFGSSIGGAQFDPIRGSAAKITNEYANAGKIRFVYHTMAFLGQESVDAGNAAFCAREIGGDEAFFRMHDKLFSMQGSENSGAFSKDNLKKYAAQIGFNSTNMTGCIDSGKYNSAVSKSNSDAGNAGVQGTPFFTVNGVQTSPEYSALKSSIDAILGK